MLGQWICAFLILIDIAKLLSWRSYSFHSRKQLVEVSASPMLSGNAGMQTAKEMRSDLSWLCLLNLHLSQRTEVELGFSA